MLNADNRTIHVVHLIGSTGLYGAERWILALMRAMDTQKFRSTLINLVDDENEKSAVVKAAEQRGLAAFDFVTGGKFNVLAAKRLAGWARKEQVDIIHGHGFKSDLLGLLTAKLAGCRVMTTPHGWSMENDMKLQMYEKLDRFSFRFMDMVCPLSAGLYKDAKKWTRKNIRLISNGVDIDELNSLVSIGKSNDTPFVVGYIGRMVASKDVDTLIHAVKKLVDSERLVKIQLIGDGDQLLELKKLVLSLGINNVVEFYGFRTDAANFLKSFDCFVLPSLSEGTPRCIMEAMALNVPVVASDIPGNRLLVAHNETGLLFPVGDSQRLSECITFMIDHSAEALEMAKRGNLKVENEYSNKKMAKEYSEVYQELVASRL